MMKYVCEHCGYTYDPSVGDDGAGIKAGTPFEDFPANWVCPLCGAEKKVFYATDSDGIID